MGVFYFLFHFIYFESYSVAECSLLKEVMTEVKGYRVPVANTCHMQEKPHLDCSTGDWSGLLWCRAS